MKSVRPALSIRAQLLLVLSVFLIVPWLGYEYVREIERLLRDAQEQTLAGTAQAVATALHERARLSAACRCCGERGRGADRRAGRRRRRSSMPSAAWRRGPGDRCI